MNTTPIPTRPKVSAVAAPEQDNGATPVLEIATVRAKAEPQPVAVSNAARAMTEFLIETRAVLSSTLRIYDTGLWTDHITWTDMTAARNTAENTMTDLYSGPFMASVEPTSGQMRHARI